GLRRDRELLRQAEVRARRAVFVDDALGQQVGDGLSLTLRLVDTKGVIEAAVFADQDDDVLDRRRGLDAGGGLLVLVVVLAAFDFGEELEEAIEMETLVPIAEAAMVGGVGRGRKSLGR